MYRFCSAFQDIADLVSVLSTSEWELMRFQGRFRKYPLFAITVHSNRIFSTTSKRAQISVIASDKTEKLSIVTLVLINESCSTDFSVKVTNFTRRHFVYYIFVIFPSRKIVHTVFCRELNGLSFGILYKHSHQRLRKIFVKYREGHSLWATRYNSHSTDSLEQELQFFLFRYICDGQSLTFLRTTTPVN